MEFLWPNRDAVVRTARFLVKDEAEADDLAQETMLKAFRAIDRFETGTDARAWLLTILRNARVDRLRSNAAHKMASLDAMTVEPEVELENRQHASPADPRVVFEQFSDSEVIDALQELPEEMRWTLLLTDVEGLDQAEAAQILHVPLGTIKSRAHRARQILYERLEKRARELRLIR